MTTSTPARAARAAFLVGALAFHGTTAATAAAQASSDPLGDVAVGVAVPPTIAGLSPSARDQLEARLSTLLASSGLSGLGMNAPFVAVPTVVVTDRGRVETTLEKNSVVLVDLTLVVKQQRQATVFSSWTRRLPGIGPTRDAAITDAMASLRAGDSNFDDFAKKARDGIVGYYETNCEGIRADARRLATTGSPREGVAMLVAVPREARGCHKAVGPDVERMFATYQQNDCQARVRRARAAVANREWDDATEALDGIDPTAPCAADADALIGQMERKVDQTEEQRIRLWIGNRRQREAGILPGLKVPGGVESHRTEIARLDAVRFFNQRPARPQTKSGL